MAKKSVKYKHMSKEIVKKPLSDREIQLALIENFVNLQKVLTNLSVKFDNLAQNMNNLLQLFEISAKSFIRKQEEGSSTGDEKDLLRKLDTLLDQNKTIARGLTLIEEKIRHKTSEENSRIDMSDLGVIGRPKPRPLPKI